MSWRSKKSNLLFNKWNKIKIKKEVATNSLSYNLRGLEDKVKVENNEFIEVTEKLE